MSNKKKPRNTILDWLTSNKLFFNQDAAKSVGEEIVSVMVDAFWYIDGHHKTLADRSHSVPDMFQRFSGYNTPEVHKHKKKVTENMKSVDLHRQSSTASHPLYSEFVVLHL